ncbi:hypothetical protein JYQ62_35125 [Nostoc sp. UHCC 0702]|nr:hypothetical protein JYQ62_35125 [Nostoc sp. UHCC 0702]
MGEVSIIKDELSAFTVLILFRNAHIISSNFHFGGAGEWGSRGDEGDEGDEEMGRISNDN